jgi:multimeric flavodoxin WrbA
MQDELTPLLEKFREADAVFLGSPIYFGNVTGELQSFMERLFFPYYIYTKEKKRTLFPKKK